MNGDQYAMMPAQTSKFETHNFIGVDLGGTKIAAAVVDASSGAVAARESIPTEAHAGPDAVLARMGDLIVSVGRAAGLAPEQIGAVGVGVPGPFDQATGQTIFLPNLAGLWRGVRVRDGLRRAVDRPIWLINDARAFVLAEAIFGAGRGANTVVGLTIGTGIGGGIAIGGRLHLGIDGSAGEVGHMTIDPHGAPCGCGNRGCLETFASGPSIATLGVRAALMGVPTQIGELAGQDLNKITPEIIQQAADAGDQVAREILSRAGAALGVGVANLVTVLSPDCVILGGSVARLGEWLLAPVRAAVHERCRAIPVEQVRISAAALGGDAGAIGAAVWASQQGRGLRTED
jgi:glucokinase